MTAGARHRVLIIGSQVAILLGVCGFALWRSDPLGERNRSLSKRFTFQAPGQTAIDPATAAYRESGRIALAAPSPRVIAIGLEDAIYLAGGSKTLTVFSRDGQPSRTISLPGDVSCLAVGSAEHKYPGTLYCGLGRRVLRLDPAGQLSAEFTEGLDDKSLLTAVALTDDECYVADAGNRIVLRYDLAGKLLGRIGGRDPGRNVPGFIIPSPYFDLAATPDGLLRVVNPGARKILTFTHEGGLMGSWGGESEGDEVFFGCCNPAHIALLPGGKLVTIEKGLPRIKVYHLNGTLDALVAGPKELAPGARIEDARDESRLQTMDAAADSRGRILVLDPNVAAVRIFEPRTPTGSE